MSCGYLWSRRELPLLSASQRLGRSRHSPTRSQEPHACSSHVGRRRSLSVRNASPAVRGFSVCSCLPSAGRTYGVPFAAMTALEQQPRLEPQCVRHGGIIPPGPDSRGHAEGDSPFTQDLRASSASSLSLITTSNAQMALLQTFALRLSREPHRRTRLLKRGIATRRPWLPGLTAWRTAA